MLGPGAELRHVAGLARLDSEQAANIADSLIESGLLSAHEPLSFSQPVVATAITAALSPIERATLHRRASRILESEDAPAHRIAAHLMDATRNGSGWAVEALCEAAAGSLGAGRPAEAVRYLRRALEEPPPRACAHMWSSSWAAPRPRRRARGGPPAERGRGIRDRRARAARQRPRRGPRLLALEGRRRPSRSSISGSSRRARRTTS